MADEITAHLEDENIRRMGDLSRRSNFFKSLTRPSVGSRGLKASTVPLDGVIKEASGRPTD